MFICNACNGEINPKNRFSILIECPYCHTTYRKVGEEFSGGGKVSILPPDMSFIQIGTSGHFEGQLFTIIGRIKVGWEQGNWNEWLADFGNGKTGWLSDFTGAFYFTFKIEAPFEIDLRSIKAGQTLALNNQNFSVSDIKTITYVGFEGELPFERKINDTAISIDLQSDGTACAFLDNFDETVNIYCGTRVDPDTLGFENIRLIDGW